MAVNSRREQIIVHIVDLIKDLSSIKTVKRVRQTYSELQQFAVTQLPLVAVVGRLPLPTVPGGGRSSHRSTRTCMDVFISELVVDLFVYGQELKNPDVLISNLADDLWRTLYTDQTKGKLVIDTWVLFEEEPEFWHPFVAFKVSAKMKYTHTTGGI